MKYYDNDLFSQESMELVFSDGFKKDGSLYSKEEYKELYGENWEELYEDHKKSREEHEALKKENAAFEAKISKLDKDDLFKEGDKEYGSGLKADGTPYSKEDYQRMLGVNWKIAWINTHPNEN